MPISMTSFINWISKCCPDPPLSNIQVLSGCVYANRSFISNSLNIFMLSEHINNNNAQIPEQMLHQRGSENQYNLSQMWGYIRKITSHVVHVAPRFSSKPCWATLPQTMMGTLYLWWRLTCHNCLLHHKFTTTSLWGHKPNLWIIAPHWPVPT